MGETTESPTRLFLLDDHELVRRGIADLLHTEPDLEVVGEAGTAADALAAVPSLLPDVAILDVQLPDGNGIDVCRELRSTVPQVACVILTSYDDRDALLSAVLAGAAGYLLKQIRGTNLVDGIRRVARGESLLDPSLAEQVVDGLRAPSDRDERLAELTERERAILHLIADGLTNRQIAAELNLAEGTIRRHLDNIYTRLAVTTRTAAVAAAAHRVDIT